MSTQDLIAALQGDMRVDAEGSFTLNREKAQEKLRTFQVAEPQKYVLHLVALAALKQATAVHVRCDSDDVVVQFDGLPITATDLDDLYGSSFAAARTDEQRARQQLAVAIHAALALNPRHVRVCSGEGDAAVSMVVRHGRADEIGGAVKGAPKGTEIHVKQRFRPGLVKRFVQHVRGELAEATWLRERCKFSTVPIFLNGEPISAGLRITNAAHAFSHRDESSRGVAGMVQEPLAAVVRLVRHGVWLHDVPAPHLPLGFAAVISDDLLLTDLSGDKVVQDEHHARCVRLAESLAAAVIGSLIGPGEVVVTPPVAQRLEPVWQAWAEALQVETAIGSVMARVVRWPDIFGRMHSLARLHAAHAARGYLAGAFGDWQGRLPETDEVVVQRTTHASDELLARIFAEELRDVAPELDQRVVIEQNRRRWRAQPAAATLSAASYQLTGAFEVNLGGVQVRGQVGLRRTPGLTSTLRVVVDGCLLFEREADAPIAGIDVLLAGALPIREDFTGPVTGDLLAASLGACLGAARTLADAAVQGGQVPEELEARRAFIHGYLRAHSRGDALRALMAVFEFPDEEQAIKRMTRSLPPHPVAPDLCMQPWLRGVYGFTMANGAVLEAADVGRLLDAEGVAPTWVSDDMWGHPRFELPVLRLAAREAEALRWLFGGRVARAGSGEYATELAKAAFLDRPEAASVLSEETCTPHVVIASGGLQIGAAFVRNMETWWVSYFGRRARTEVVTRGRLLCEVWIAAPIPGVRFAIVGDGLTIKPTWDGVEDDQKFAEVAAAAIGAIPALVRAAVASLPNEWNEEVAEAWRAGILAALTATFPRPAWRTAFAGLVARHGRSAAEERYMKLLALTLVAKTDAMNAWIDKHAADVAALGDVVAAAARLEVEPRDEAEVHAFATVLAELRAALGQVGGSSWLEDVGRSAPEVSALRLFRRVDRELVSLAQVRAQGDGGALHLDATEYAWPIVSGASKLADEEARAALRCLFDERRQQAPGPEEPEIGKTAEELIRVMREIRRTMKAPTSAMRVLPSLLAVAVSAAKRGGGIGVPWRRGLVLALGATFPAAELRRKFQLLERAHGGGAEAMYYGVLLRARRIGMDTLRRELELASDDALTVMPTVLPKSQVKGLRDVLGMVRVELGQVGTGSLLADVAAFSAEVGRLPLFTRIDGSTVTLEVVAAQAAAGRLYVCASAGPDERPRAYLRSLRVDAEELSVLEGLYGSEVVTTVAPPPQTAEMEKAASRGQEVVGSSRGGLPTRTPRKPRAEGEDAPGDPNSPEWQTLLRLAQAFDGKQATVPAAPTVSASDPALGRGMGDAATDRLIAEVRARPGPSTAPKLTTPPPPPPPTPADRMIAAIQSELHALRRGHEGLLTGFNLEHVRAVAGAGRQALRCDKDGVVLDPEHPRVAAAIAGYGHDRVWISFLVSQVYTALNVWREDITDVDEASFHRRHLEWLRGELVRRG